MDKNNKPLAILPHREILEQRLYHRSVALHARDAIGRHILRISATGQFSLYGYAPLPAGHSAEDFCAGFLNPQEGGRNLKFLGLTPPCAENSNSFTSIFTTILSKGAVATIAALPDNFLLADHIEIMALVSHQYPFHPFLISILKKYAKLDI